MPKQKSVKVTSDQEKANSNNFIVVHDQVLQQWVCDELIKGFDAMPIVEVGETDTPNDYKPTDPSMENQNHRFELQGRIHGTVQPHTPLFEKIFDLITFALPKGYEFATVNFVQFIKYTEGSHFPWHQDKTDPNDTGTSLLFMNDNFIGGQLTVAGHKFCNKQGTIVAFNNSQNVWHSVEPILQGTRYVLAIWYGKPNLEDDLFTDADGEPRHLSQEEINKLTNLGE
tara:strand:+ start:582 stop:1262 length:681 start_codon:yes stop_codon:yes gene_type:complete